MKRITMKAKGAFCTVETSGFSGSECRTETLEKFYNTIGMEVVGDTPTAEANLIGGMEVMETQDA